MVLEWLRYEGEDVNHVQPLELFSCFFFYIERLNDWKIK
jgi:hypothetical protein